MDTVGMKYGYSRDEIWIQWWKFEDLKDYGSVKGNIGILARLDEIQIKAEKWKIDYWSIAMQ